MMEKPTNDVDPAEGSIVPWGFERRLKKFAKNDFIFTKRDEMSE